MSYIAIDKSYIESRIAELEELTIKWKARSEMGAFLTWQKYENQLRLYKDILSHGIEIPVEKSWNDFDDSLNNKFKFKDYPNGVIIKK